MNEAETDDELFTCGRDSNKPVLLVEAPLQHQLFKVDVCHRKGDGLQAAVLPDYSHLSLQAEKEIKHVLII